MSLVIQLRYRVETALGRGPRSDVLHVADVTQPKSSAPLVLKRLLLPAEQLTAHLPMPGGGALVRLLDGLTELHHPHLLPVLGYGVDDSAPQPTFYYTRPLLPVYTPITTTDLPLKARLRLIGQVLGVLAYLHRRGQLHRSLKPENIGLVEGSVRVMDFGLGQPIAPETDLPIPVLSYLAPEQLDGGLATVQTDLYAVGIILYELVTGRFPYQRSTPRELSTNIRLFTPSVPTDDISPALAALISRLMAKDPTQRPSTAREALAQLEAALGEPLPVLSEHNRHPFIPVPRLHGRDAEIAQIDSLLASAHQGRGGAIFFTGVAGIGKTALLREARRRAILSMGVALYACADPIDSPPFSVWWPLARCLSSLEAASSDERAILAQMQGDEQPGMAPNTPDALLTTFAELLPIASSAKRPLVLLLDDLQHADSDSRWLLEQLVMLAASLPLAIVGAYESADAAPLGLPAASPLKRLSVRYISGISQQLLGSAGELPIVNALLFRETDGNPYFLLEVMRALAEQTGNLEDIGIKTLPNQLFAEGLAEALASRLTMLSDDQRALLATLALDHTHIDPQLLAALADSQDPYRWLLDAHEAHILSAEGGVWHFAHVQLQRASCTLLSDVERQEAHLRLAVWLDQAQSAPAHVAYHYQQAGRADLAFPLALRAAELAFRAGAAEAAIQQLERWLPTADTHATRVPMLIMLGTASLQIGDLDRAQHYLAQALPLATHDHDREQVLLALVTWDELRDDTVSALSRLQEVAARPSVPMRAQALMRLCHLAYAAGNSEQAIQHGEQALEAVGLTLPEQVQTLLAMGLAHLDHDDLPRAVERLGQALELAQQAHLREQARVLSTLAGLYLVRGGYEAAYACFGQRLTLAVQRCDLANAARALGNLGRIDTLNGQFRRAEQLLTLGLRMAQVVGSALTEAGIALNLGQLYLKMGQHPRAQAAFDAAAHAAARGDHTALQTQAATYQLVALAQSRQLSVAEALARLDDLYAAAVDAEARALIDDWRWQLDPAQTAAAQRAADHYAIVFSTSHDAEVGARYAALTGQTLPAPALPPPPASAAGMPIDWDALLTAAAALLPTAPHTS